MPFYEYRCDKCGHELEVMHKIEKKFLGGCPECGRATLSKKISCANFVLKGAGFYQNDYKEKK